MTLVCPDCFDDKVLRRRLEKIRPQFTDEKCDFHPSKKGIPADSVAELFDGVIRAKYQHADYDYNGEPRGEDLNSVVTDLGNIDDYRAAEAIASALIRNDPYWLPDGDTPFYSEEVGYESSEYMADSYSYLWQGFQSSILHERRFFNERAIQNLTSLFGEIHKQRTANGRSPVYMLGQERPVVIFRARASGDGATRKSIHAEPWKNLGCPPAEKRVAGRMNPSGIAVFYGAFEVETCFAELRPAVGSTLTVANFNLRRPICVLDLTQFTQPQRVNSPFVEGYSHKVAQWVFLEAFQNQISKPISELNSHLDYIPTQVIAEFLTAILKMQVGGKDTRIEGIIYGSSQRPSGKNIAIFGEAAQVFVEHSEEKPEKSGYFGELIEWSEKQLARNYGLEVVKGTVLDYVVRGAEYKCTPITSGEYFVRSLGADREY
ncbi:RES domain-containing protein [Mesorhizobium sp. M0306]|uniref:RES domain-containing protein n=1 Tax=Mesorhizobium sp. M0306 TaxID=2956932 RepID=UPI00333CEFBC